MAHAGRRINGDVTPDGDGLVSHAGSALLAQVADKAGLIRALSREQAIEQIPPSTSRASRS